jgi:hypothetical protein
MAQKPFLIVILIGRPPVSQLEALT